MVFVETLPLTVLLLLAECAVGGTLILLFTDLEGSVSPGFLISSGAFLAVDAGIAYLLKFGYGNAAGAIGIYLAALTALLVAYVALVALKRRPIARLFSILSVLAGGAVLVQSATLETHYAGISTLAGVGLSAWVAGAALTAMLLGHWYLVTPLLSPKSLTRVTEILLTGLVLQSVFLIFELASSGVAGSAIDRVLAAIASAGFVFWFRILVGTVFPLVLSVLTWRACQLRAMQTATGFLYIIFGCVGAGDVAAKVFSVITSISV